MWLIFLVVGLFTAFPAPFAILVTVLYVPLTLALIGVVLRGAAFIFRTHGLRSEKPWFRMWSRIFSFSSVVTPFFLGLSAAAVASGQIRVTGVPIQTDLGSLWLTPFALTIGLMAITLCATLAAIFLTVEATNTKEADLAEAFRWRGLIAGALTAALGALGVSLRTTATSLAIILVLGTPAAYLLGTRSFRGAAALETVLEVPLVLPPAVAGIALLAAFGRFGLLGGTLHAAGIEVGLTPAAVVMALTFVAMPFYVRQAIGAFASVDRQVLAASRTLGAGDGQTFLRVAVPLARKGLSAGAALAFARALGEFGATIMFAGNLQGRTQTLPLAYSTAACPVGKRSRI